MLYAATEIQRRLTEKQRQLLDVMQELNASYELRSPVAPERWKIPIDRVAWLFDDRQTLTQCIVTQVDKTRRIITARFMSMKGGVVPAHQHHSRELIRILEGRCLITVGGRARDMVAGDVVEVPSGTVHMAEFPDMWCIAECEYYLGRNGADKGEIFYRPEVDM